MISSAHEKLLRARLLRTRPHLDNKILCSWNGLAISALCAGHQELKDKRYLEAAVNCAAFIKKNMYKNSALLRSFCQDEAKYNGYLEDYTYLIQGLLDLSECSKDKGWQTWALDLQEKVDQLFWDEAEHGYFYTEENAPAVIIRKKDFTDGALPSANGIGIMNLLRIGKLTGEQKYAERAKETISAMSGLIDQFPSAAASALLGVDYLTSPDNGV